MIMFIKNLFLMGLGIIQFTHDEARKIHKGFVYGYGISFWKRMIFWRSKAKKESLKDLTKRGEFLVDIIRLKVSEFGNEIVKFNEESIAEFFDIKADAGKKLNSFINKNSKDIERKIGGVLINLNLSFLEVWKR